MKTVVQDHKIPTRDLEAGEDVSRDTIEADEAEVGLENLENLMAEIKLDRKGKEQKGKKNGWIARKSNKAAKCMSCSVFMVWEGKCKDCTDEQYKNWLDKLLPLDSEHSVDIKVYFK